MRIDVLTLFPAVFEPLLAHGQIRIGREKGLVDIHTHDFRAFATDKHRSVDDKPYGGGPGMVLMCGPVYACDEDVVTRGCAALGNAEARPRRVMLSPQGRPLEQALLEELSREPWLMLLCGHYEGFDDRIASGLGYEEVSIGDYVLSGGEVPAMVLIDGVTRLIPGVLGAPDGASSDSFSSRHGEARLLEGPQFTRPREFRGMSVPDVLLSGDHAAVAAWRRAQARQRTEERRPELLEGHRTGGTRTVPPETPLPSDPNTSPPSARGACHPGASEENSNRPGAGPRRDAERRRAGEGVLS